MANFKCQQIPCGLPHRTTPYVQEAHGRPSRREQSIIHQREDGGSRGCRCARAIGGSHRTIPDSAVVLTLRRNIGNATPAGIIQSGVISADVGEVFGDSSLLVSWSWEVVTEATSTRESDGKSGIVCGDYTGVDG